MYIWAKWSHFDVAKRLAQHCKLTTFKSTICQLKKMKIEQLHDPVFPILGIYLKEIKQLENCLKLLKHNLKRYMHLLTIAQFTLVKSWKQCKHQCII